MKLVKVFIGSDHAGFGLKEFLKKYLAKAGIPFKDFGTESGKSVDYPYYAEKVGSAVSKNSGALGILACGTGIGMCIAANKLRGIRAALCTDERMAKAARKHNDANVLCLGGRILKKEKAIKIAGTFLKTEFSGEQRHVRRIGEIAEIEKKCCL